MKQDEVIVGVLLFLFGALTSVLASNLKLGTLNAIGTGFFPLSLGILLMILSSVYLAQIILPSIKPPSSKARTQSSLESTPAPIRGKADIFLKESQPIVNVVITLGSIGFFALFLDTLGYPLCVFLLLVVLMRTLGLKNWIVLLTLAIIVTTGSWLLFVKLLKIPLPQGVVGL